MEDGWSPIDTAPLDGTIIELVNENEPEQQPVAMFWSGEFWEGKTFAAMGSRRTIWDSRSAQPTHWRKIVE